MMPASVGRLRRAARIALTACLCLSPAALSAQSLNKTTLSFGNQAVNVTSAARTITFKNTLLAPVTLTSAAVSGGNAGDFTATPSCALPAVIQPGKSCKISVRFTPPAMLARSSTLIVTHSGPAGPLSVALTGMGVSPVSLSPSPSLSFGNLMLGTASASKTVTLTNALPAALPITAIFVSPQFVRTGGTCPTVGTLASGASCTILVAFAPTAAGAAPGTLMVSHTGPANPPSSSLTGTGISPLSTSPSTLALSTRTVGTPPSAPKNLTVTNKSAAAIGLGSLTASGDFAVASSTCGASLAAGAKCVIGVTFAPTIVGARAGTLSIAYTGVGSPLQIALSGTGNATGLVSLAVTPGNPAIPAGGSVAFTATGAFSDGHTASLTTSVVWSLTGTPGVAAISNSAPTQGLAQGLNGGTTTVKATLGAIAGSTQLTVTSGAPQSIEVTPPAASLGLGLTQQFTATATFPGGGTSNVTATADWDLEFPTRGRVNATGLYTALASGGSTVSAAVAAVSGQAAVTAAAPVFAHKEQHTATLLHDGRVLIAGGLDPALVTIASAEIFDPATGTFTAVAPMGSPRRSHLAALLADGRVLVTGGVPTSANSIPIATAEIFDPVLGTWSPTGSMSSIRRSHTMSLVGTKVLIAGGFNASASLASAELFDPSTGTFSATGTLATARSSHTATRLADGRVLVAGGTLVIPGNPVTRLASAEIYNPATGTWSPTGAMPMARVTHTATWLLSNKVLLVGGTGDGGVALTSTVVFDPATGTWSPAGAIPVPVSFHTASLLPSGQVIVAGGSGLDNKFTAVYDPASGTFEPGPPLAFGRSIHAAAVLNSGAVLWVGGSNGQFEPPEGATSAELRLGGAVLTGLTIEPAANSATHPSTLVYRAIGTFSDGSRGDVSGSATWSVTPNSVAIFSGWSVFGRVIQVTTTGPGTATVRATYGGFSFDATLSVH